MFDIAYAMGQSGAGGQGAGGFSAFIPLVLMVVIFYFLLIRPQQKKSKEHKQMIASLKKGDRIITTGGLHGKVTGMDDATLTVEISDKVRVKISRGYIASVISSSSEPQESKSEKAVEKKE